MLITFRIDHLSSPKLLISQIKPASQQGRPYSPGRCYVERKGPNGLGTPGDKVMIAFNVHRGCTGTICEIKNESLIVAMDKPEPLSTDCTHSSTYVSWGSCDKGLKSTIDRYIVPPLTGSCLWIPFQKQFTLSLRYSSLFQL